MEDNTNSLNSFGDEQGKDTKMDAVKLNPYFRDLGKPETISNHIQELKKQAEIEKQDPNPFPIEVFPDSMQEIIRATSERLKYPIDFMGASMLYAVSVAMGNTLNVEIKNGYKQNAVLYMALVGRRGTTKTHPLTYALDPITKLDILKHQKFKREKKEFEEVESLTKKERKEQGRDELSKPFWEQRLVTDFTPEALSDVHNANKRGVGVYSDELASWFKNFNRYNSGSEEQFWLSIWSGKEIRINRKTSDPILIPFPFISVAGTIQPGVLDELAKDRTENGFLDRFLFVMPTNLKKEYWSEKELEPVITENWEAIITKILNIDLVQDENFNPKPEILRFTPDAKNLMFEWQRKITDLSNKSDSDVVKGIYAKIEPYAMRFALCLEVARYACNKGDKQAISFDSVQGALKLAEYFKNSAIKVQSVISNKDPLAKLTLVKQELYDKLEETFSTGEGLIVAENLGIPERTFKAFLRNKELFVKPEYGHYEKLL